MGLLRIALYSHCPAGLDRNTNDAGEWTTTRSFRAQAARFFQPLTRFKADGTPPENLSAPDRVSDEAGKIGRTGAWN